MHEKFASGRDWVIELPPAVLLKVSSRGIVGADRAEMLKRSSERVIAYYKKAGFLPDEEPLHAVALTSTRGGGPNRNGDAYSCMDCEKRADTFRTMGRWYYDHKNKDKSKSYGVIKTAWWDPDMRRVECLVALNKTAEAARRNGGLVAERSLEKLASRGEVDTSMAYKLAADKCSWCGNRAASRKEYCDASSCGAGGLKANLGRIVKVAGRLHHLHADNPDGYFHDLSDVGRPADPTSAAAPLNATFAKAASIDLGPGVDLGARTRYAILSLVEKAASVEFEPSLAASSHPDFFANVKIGSDDDLVKLAQANVVLPLETFANYRGCSGRLAKVAAGQLTNIAQFLRHDPEIAVTLATPAWNSAALSKRALTEWSLDERSLERRGREAFAAGRVADAFVKTADATSELELAAAKELATDYVRYKVAALELIHRIGFDLGAAAAAVLARHGRAAE